MIVHLVLAAGILSRPVAISADRLEVFDRQNKAIYRGHAKAQRDSTTLTCNTLTVYFSESRDVLRLEAEGDVVAVDQDRTARGDKAEFNNETGLLRVFGAPSAQSGDRHILGDEIRFTTGTEFLEVIKARTTDSQMVIDADRLELEGNRHIAKWLGHVHAKKKTTTLRAPILIAHYDEHGNVQRVEAKGGVEATDKNRWAKGANAKYDAVSGRLEVTGKPEARQGKNHLKGRKITFVSGSDTIEVDDAQSVIDVKDKQGK